MKILSIVLRLIIAFIFIQTLYFKFTAHPESVALFEKMGMEPLGRLLTGGFELLASVLLLIPATIFIGALLSLGLMSGALLSHLMVIGIETNGDGGQLFMMALVVFVFSLLLLWLHKDQVISLKKRFFKS